MNLLCTGGAGYVGSACLRWLLKQGHNAIAYDDLSEGNAGAVPEGRLVEGDILDGEKLCEALSSHKIEGVLHFAAVANVPDSIKDPDTYWRINVNGTKVVLDAMRRCGVDKIIFSSTAATYGFEGEMPLSEATRQVPQVPYGSTKLAGEWIIREYAQAYNMGYTFLRYFNACGADQDGEFGEDRPKESHLIPVTMAVAVGKREKLFVYGTRFDTRDGTCLRDYVHNDDLAQAHERCMQTLEPGMGRAYNLGTGTGTTVLEVHAACEKAVGRPIPYETADARPGDPDVLVASPDKIIRELGWSPQFSSIDHIVKTAWMWHSRYPDGYTSKGAAHAG